MPFTTWIRDALGIRKDVVDTKKAKLEITKLEAEERERKLITPVTIEDIKKYNPTLQKLAERILKEQSEDLNLSLTMRLELASVYLERRKRRKRIILLAVLLLGLLIAGFLLFPLAR